MTGSGSTAKPSENRKLFIAGFLNNLVSKIDTQTHKKSEGNQTMRPGRRRKSPFDDLFDDFDDEFRRMEENMSRIFGHIQHNLDQRRSNGDPYVYGFSLRVGPDGKPHIEEFGNVSNRQGIQSCDPSKETCGREPLTDTIEGDDDVTIIAELPGIEKDDIVIDVDEESLTLDVDTEKRRYRKDLTFPCKVDPDSGRASHKNGVLEVKFKRQKPKPSGPKTKIKID